MVESILVVIVVAAVFIGVIYTIKRSRRKKSADMSMSLFPVWAGQGPFKDGTESAHAMYGAWLVIFGNEQTEEAKKVFDNHKASYDASPEKWEKLRIEHCKDTQEIQDKIDLAKGFAAVENLNDTFISAMGFNVESANDPDGSSEIVADDEVKQKQEAGANITAIGFGEALVNSDNKESKALLEFIMTLHYVANDKESITVADIERIYTNLIATAKDEHIDKAMAELIEEFNKLHKAYFDGLLDDEKQG
jgi:hypothetical protein